MIGGDGVWETLRNHRFTLARVFMLLSLVLGVATTSSFLFSAPQRRCPCPPARTRTLGPQLSAPAELAEAPWLVKVAQECPFAESRSGESRMGDVLEWLSTMLVTLELDEGAGGASPVLDEDDELDEDFVNAARPWLHTKAFFDVPVNGLADAMWEQMEAATFLRPEGEGGSLVLLLPSALPMPLLDDICKTVKKVVAGTSVGTEISVTGCHPDRKSAVLRSPVPLIQLFSDRPGLLVDGGSASDMSAFL